MKKKSDIFLGKSGKIYGPYTEVEFQGLMSSGQISQYTWIWDHSKEHWNPLEEPPPAPTSLSTQTQGTQNSMNWSNVKALCFDSSNLIHGELSSVTQTGCQLRTKNKTVTHFACGAAEMNLYDPSQDQCVSVPVRVLAIEPIMGEGSAAWNLVIRWQELPALR